MLQLDAGLEDDEEFCLVKRILGKAAVGQWGMIFGWALGSERGLLGVTGWKQYAANCR